MSWKRIKDRSELVAEGRVWIDAPPRKHYYSIYLWSSTKALNAAACPGGWLAHPDGKEDESCGAFVAHSLRRYRIDADGTKTATPLPKLGEIHFEWNRWPMEVVAHECQHIAIGASSALGMDFDQLPDDGDAQEVLCDRLGEAFDAVYRWLWEVDSPDGWKRLEDPAVRAVA